MQASAQSDFAARRSRATLSQYAPVHRSGVVLIGCALQHFERAPPLLIPGLFLLVVFFEFVYYTYVLAFVEPIFGAVPWVAVLLGLLVAIVSIIAYCSRRHSELPGKLLRR